MLSIYLAWNSWWLSQGQVPESLFTAITGFPSPTTGGTRAVMCLLKGEWRESFLFNPCAIPIVALLGWTIAVIVRQRFVQGRFAIPVVMFYTWVVLLAIAWLAKFATPTAYW